MWAEAFQRTRRHLFSASSLKKKLLTVYLAVTVFLYVMLILLYSLFLFSKKDSARILDGIYVLLALMDMLVPLILIISRCCMAFVFSGFPVRCAPLRVSVAPGCFCSRRQQPLLRLSTAVFVL